MAYSAVGQAGLPLIGAGEKLLISARTSDCQCLSPTRSPSTTPPWGPESILAPVSPLPLSCFPPSPTPAADTAATTECLQDSWLASSPRPPLPPSPAALPVPSPAWLPASPPGPPQNCSGQSQGLEVPLHRESLQVRLWDSIPPPLLSHPAPSQVGWRWHSRAWVGFLLCLVPQPTSLTSGWTQ